MIQGMINNWKIISIENKNKIKKLVIIGIGVSLLETIGLITLVKFINKILDNSTNINALGLNIYDNITIFELTLIIILIYLMMFGLKYFQTKLTSDVSFKLGSEIGVKLLNTALSMDYEKFIDKKGSDEIANVFVRSNKIASEVILPTINIIISSMSIILISFGMLSIAEKWLIYFLSILACIYLIIARLRRKLVKSKAKIMDAEYPIIIDILSKAFRNFKIIKIDLDVKRIVEKFEYHDNRLKEAAAYVNFYSTIPRYGIEYFGIIAIAIMILIESVIQDKTNNITTFVVVIMMLQKIVPSFQLIFYSLTQIKVFAPSLIEINEALKKLEFWEIGFKHELNNNDCEINYDNKIELHNISYKYKNIKVLDNFCLQIKRGDIIKIMGVSGSGKSTLIGIITGLLRPNLGKIIVDNIELDYKRVSKWWSIIGYVPQEVILTEEKVIDNIIPSKSNSDEELDKVKKAMWVACLDDELDQNLLIGDNSISISGGQRQRLGIAKAIYKQPKIIILDESTNSLDNGNEERLLKRLVSYCKERKITLITVMHTEKYNELFNQIIHLKKK